MKKLLRITTILAVASFFINFMTYQTSRMKTPQSFNFIEVLFGKRLIADGVAFNSGFNPAAAAALAFALLAVAFVWIIPNIKISKYLVSLSSAVSVIFFSMCTAPFGKESEFVTQLSQNIPGGVKFGTILSFAIIIFIMVINVIIGIVTEKFIYNLMQYRWYYIMFATPILFFVVFCYLPMVGLSIMFLDYNVADLTKSTWAGLKWFRHIINSIDGEFGMILRNTLIISATRIVTGFPCPIILALLFNECGNLLYKKIIQTITYLPHFISWSIIAGLIIALFSSQESLINGILAKYFGNTEGFYLLQEVDYIRGTIVLSGIWKEVGWGAIIYMAALTGISPELYESATLDGAGKLAQTWYITLPGISNLITMQMIFAVSGIMGVGFEQTFNLVTPMTVAKGKVLALYTFDIGIRGTGNLGLGGNYSFATTMGFMQSMLSLFLVIMANTVGKRINPDGAIW